MGEFSAIKRLAAAIPSAGANLVLPIGDDAAVIDPGKNHWAVSTDTMNEGIHFLPDCDPRVLGHRSLAVSLSDMAAMGADPQWVFLNLSLPDIDDHWLDCFSAGFADLANRYSVVLAGGDTTRGPRSISTTVLGNLPAGKGLRRSGARSGDLILVSGCPGRAALALRMRIAGSEPSAELAAAFDRPEPRVRLGLALLDRASACVDISDGLLADLQHVTTASSVAARVELANLPASDCFAGKTPGEQWELQLAGGDDYELCFTLPPEFLDEVLALEEPLGVRISVIGKVIAGEGVQCLEADGRVFHADRTGWDHFQTGALAQ